MESGAGGAGAAREGNGAGAAREGTGAGVAREGTEAGAAREGTDAGVAREGTDAGAAREGTDAGAAREGAGTGIGKPLLELDKLSLSFGGLRAISELDLVVSERQIVSVIGPNGAGKTSVFNVITGVYKPTEGDVRFDGQSIAGKRPDRITRLGIARTFQSLRLFLNMTVKDNVKSATYGGTKASPAESILRLPRARREEREVDELVEQILSFFGERLMGYRWAQPAYVLSYANRRRLEIARALATRPKLLLLDEPAAGMNPNETHEVTELIGRLRDELGVAILVIEHDMHVVEGISDKVVALDHGTKIAEGSFDTVATHPMVVEAYLGRDPEALAEA